MLIWAQLNLLAHFNEVEKVPIKRETLNRYIQILVDAKIVYRCQRFDMKSRKSLTREEKYYLADLGFYFAMNTDTRINYGPVLENVTYQYLRSKGYMVSEGASSTDDPSHVSEGVVLPTAVVHKRRTIGEAIPAAASDAVKLLVGKFEARLSKQRKQFLGSICCFNPLLESVVELVE